MLSAIRTAARQSSKKSIANYAKYTTYINPLNMGSSASSQMDFLDEMDRPPSAADGYARATPAPSPNSSLSSVADLVSGLPYKLHCHSTRNNTIVTFTDPRGMPIAWYSGGSCGFKRGQRASYEAGYQCAVRMFKRIEDIAQERGAVRLALYFKGFGQGRDAMQKALLTSEGANVKILIDSVGDRTAIKIGGTRSKKMRRL